MTTPLRILAVCLAALTTVLAPPQAKASVVGLNIVETATYISTDQMTRWRLFSATSSQNGQMIGQFALGSGPRYGVAHNWLYSLNTTLSLEPKNIPAPPMTMISHPILAVATQWWEAPRQTTGTIAEQHYFAFTTAQKLFGWILADFGGPDLPALTLLSGAISVNDANEGPSPVPLPAGFVLLFSGLCGLALRRTKKASLPPA